MKKGRHNKKWTTLEIKKLIELKDENPKKTAFILNKTVGSVHQEKFRRGLTKSRIRLRSYEINSILILKGVGLNLEEISIMTGKHYSTIFNVCRRYEKC